MRLLLHGVTRIVTEPAQDLREHGIIGNSCCQDYRIEMADGSDMMLSLFSKKPLDLGFVAKLATEPRAFAKGEEDA